MEKKINTVSGFNKKEIILKNPKQGHVFSMRK